MIDNRRLFGYVCGSFVVLCIYFSIAQWHSNIAHCLYLPLHFVVPELPKPEKESEGSLLSNFPIISIIDNVGYQQATTKDNVTSFSLS